MRKHNVSPREQERPALQSSAQTKHAIPQLERRWLRGQTLPKRRGLTERAGLEVMKPLQEPKPSHRGMGSTASIACAAQMMRAAEPSHRPVHCANSGGRMRVMPNGPNNVRKTCAPRRRFK